MVQQPAHRHLDERELVRSDHGLDDAERIEVAVAYVAPAVDAVHERRLRWRLGFTCSVLSCEEAAGESGVELVVC